MAKTTVIFIALFIISTTAGIVNHISYRSSLKSWKQAVANRDQKLSECQQQVTSKPTPEPTPQPTQTPYIADDPTPAPQLTKETADLSGIMQALAQLEAATQSGVNYGTYGVLVTNAVLEVNNIRGKVSNRQVGALIGEIVWCYQSAKDLWIAAIDEKYQECGNVTSTVIQKYPQFTAFKKNATNLDTQIQYKKTLQFLWDVANERYRELVNVVQ